MRPSRLAWVAMPEGLITAGKFVVVNVDTPVKCSLHRSRSHNDFVYRSRNDLEHRGQHQDR
jgi:hypothetical protein